MDDLRHAPLYSIPECARYLGLPVSTVRGWIAKPGSDRKGGGKPLVIPAGSDPTALSFTNLVEVFVLSSLNRNRQRPTGKLLESLLSKRSHGTLPSSACSTKSDFIIDRIGYDDNGAANQVLPVHPWLRTRRSETGGNRSCRFLRESCRCGLRRSHQGGCQIFRRWRDHSRVG